LFGAAAIAASHGFTGAIPRASIAASSRKLA
jgi:hypothetical protein